MNENKARSRLDQRRAPIYEALERFRRLMDKLLIYLFLIFLFLMD